MPQTRWLEVEFTKSGAGMGVESTIGHHVIVVGGGPTGLTVAGELALAGVDVAIIERRRTQDLIGSRAGGLHSRTIEVFDQRGIANRFLSLGQVAQLAGFSQIRLDISDFPTRHPYGLALWQNHIERVLAEWVSELNVPVYRGHEVNGIAQHATGVEVRMAAQMSLRADYVVGCDGGRSVVRKSVGIEFPGWEPTMSYLLAEVDMSGNPGRTPQWGIRHDALGVHSMSQEFDGGPVRIMLTERHVVDDDEPAVEDLRAALVAVYGTDYGMHSPRWLSRSTDMARQAAAYRDRRVLLAGDAAHVHHPIGGQGLNTGVQDAVNLGWKLALVVNGSAPQSLLDSYHVERHPVAARVLRNTMAQMALLRQPGDEHTKALRDTVSELLNIDEPRRRFAAMMSGLDIRYGVADGHPLLGRRMPDLEVTVNGCSTRVFTLLHTGHGVLLNVNSTARHANGWSDRVRRVDAEYVGDWKLPVVGVVDAPAAVLIRPDGHVAWVGDGDGAGLTGALTRWFGPPHGGTSSAPARR